MSQRLRFKFFFTACIFLLSGCALFELPQARQTLNITEDLPYLPQSTHPRQRLDLFMPRSTQPVPVVVFVHGGFWNSQDKAYFRPFTGLYSNVGIALAKQGLATVVIDYRIAPEVGIAGELADIVAALNWVEKNIKDYGGDPQKIFLGGHSAGGHMALLLALAPEYAQATQNIRGYLALSPIVDLNQMQASQDAEFNQSTTYAVFGQDPEILKKFSPQSYFRPSMPPLFWAYGDQDLPFLIQQNRTALARLQALGVSQQALILENHHHEDLVLNFHRTGDILTPAIVEFIKKITSSSHQS